jgi:hypothetical protein
MGLYPVVCRIGRRWEQTVLLDDVVQFVSAPFPVPTSWQGSPTDTRHFISPTHSGAVLGRTVPPWLSDRLLGPLNATISMNVFTLLVVLTIWLPFETSSVAGLFVVAVPMGMGTGSFVPLGGKGHTHTHTHIPYAYTHTHTQTHARRTFRQPYLHPQD